MKSQTKSSLNNFRIFFAASLCQRSRRAIGGLAVLLASLLLGGPGRAAQITWTNTSGGNWSGTANWSPNQVPLSADTAVITNAANYTVTMDVSPTIAGLVVGATTGVNTQTLLVSGQTLTLNGQVTVNSQGRFNFTASTLAGAVAISGTLNWSGGSLQAGSTLTVATNGLVLVTCNGTSISGTLTNAGTIRLVGAGLTLSGNGLLGLVNLPGALVDIQNDVGISYYQQTEVMVNQGTVRKSGGSGTSVIQPILNNSGTVDAESGTLSLNNGDGAGLFLTGAGATLAYTGTYTIDPGGQLAGTGTNLLSSGTFTLNGSMTASNAVLAAGTLGGTNGVLGGTWIWKGGTIAAGSTLTVPTNGLVLVTGSGTYISGTSTNAGTIRLVDASLTLRGDGLLVLVNLPGALVDMQSDVGISYFYNTEMMVNQGTVRKSGGSGTSVISPILSNSGTVDAESGTLRLNNGNGAGLFLTGAGATLAYFGTYTIDPGGQLAGAGTNLLSGTFTLNGSMTASNAVLAAGTLGGTNGVLGGTWIWKGGTTASGSTLTVATNSLVVVTGSGKYIPGTLTNAGTIRLVDASLTLRGDGLLVLVNLPGALVDMQSDVGINYYYQTEVMVNQGTVRKSGGSGTSVIQPILNNSGTVDAESGTLRLNNGNGAGLFLTGAGATLAYFGTYTIDPGGQLAGAGTNLLSGTFTLNGSMTASNAVLAAGTLGGTNGVLGGTWIWKGGTTASGSTLTVPTNGLVLVTGSGTYISGTLTNAGTIRLVDASLTLRGDGLLVLVNLPGALVDMQSDVGISYFYNTEMMVNQGTVRKSGGSGTSVISPILSNSGTVDAESGTLRLNNGNGAGLFLTGAGATLAYFGTYTIDPGGQLAGAGTNLLSGTFTLNGSMTASNAVLAAGTLGGTNGVLGGTWIWKGGTTASGSTLTVATNSLVLVTGSGTYISGTLTNAGTIRLVDASLTLRGDGLLVLVNLPGALVDMQSDVGINYYYQTEVMVNQGTVRKSGGSGTSAIGTILSNSGTLDSQSGTLNLSGSYTLTGGTLNFGISSATSFGKINLAGAAALTGTFSANLNNGYIPVRGNSFAVLNYGSQSGSFGNFILPARNAWSTNYGATTFTLTVLNSAPVLSAQTNRSINELTLLAVSNPAVDLDLPPDTLSYRLLSPPNGANIDANGVITWTPAQAQSPGTNTITSVVTDSGTPSLSDTNSFTVVVKEVNVAPSLPVIAQTNVNELTPLTVNNTATNFNIHSTITGYALVSPPGGMSISPSGIITWTPAQAQSPGTNIITTIVTNSNPYDLINPRLTSTNQFTVVVKEVNVAPVLPVIAQTNVNELTLLTVNNTATNFNIHSTITGYALVNPPSNMVINASGVITWTPAQAQSPGTNIITTIVTNSNPYDLINPRLTSTNQFTVVVKEVNVTPVLPAIPTQTVNALTLLTVTNTAIETNIHATVGYTLVNPPGNMAINASGVITWTPSRPQGPGTNIITTIVTNTDSFDTANPHLSATNSFTVIVYAPTLAPIGNYSVNAGQTVAFTNSATDNDSTRTLSFSLISQPVGATVTPATGVFNWRPAVSQANTTNTMQVRVTDNSAPALTDTKSFTVIVNPLAPVVLKPLGYAHGQFSMSVTGSVGPDYVLQGSVTLTNWVSLGTNTPGSMPFIFTDPAAGAFSNRFYRAKQLP